ncbi:MAG: DNA-binding protein WhiA [Clostridia bacterium]|jgi:DNA-binding protein WhiA|nr:DNA-binding protein WhiA [Clostridia bacterium]
MSFSSKVKSEIVKIEYDRAFIKKMELAALVNLIGNISVKYGKMLISLHTENPALARKIFSEIKYLYNYTPEISMRRSKKLSKNRVYYIYISNIFLVERMLKEMGILRVDDDILVIANNVTELVYEDQSFKRGYLRGAFLAAGSVSDPEKGYHLEIVDSDYAHAEGLSNLINSFGLDSKIVERKGHFVVYLKEGEQISTFLNIIEAHVSLMEFENVRILKEMRNKVNRVVNCETANLNKVVKASIKQIEDIELIDKEVGIDNLPESLREVITLRVEYPNLSLKELGEVSNLKLSKSAINHRFRKIAEIASQYRKS